MKNQLAAYLALIITGIVIPVIFHLIPPVLVGFLFIPVIFFIPFLSVHPPTIGVLYTLSSSVTKWDLL